MCDLVDFFHLAGRLKSLRRAGWLRRGIKDAESVADHSFRLALLALILGWDHTPPLDRARCLALAIVHDLAEALTGDITPHDAVTEAEKHFREEAAIKRLTQLAGQAFLQKLWEEYEAGSTPEAAFVRNLDKLETLLQALEYEQSRLLEPSVLNEFWEDLPNSIDDVAARTLLQELLRERNTRV